jgi:hypothetical protein
MTLTLSIKVNKIWHDSYTLYAWPLYQIWTKLDKWYQFFPNDLDLNDQGQPKTIGFLPLACLTNVASLNNIGWTILEL